MPGLAVYASPENMEKYKVDESKPKPESEYSSPHVQRVIIFYCYLNVNCFIYILLQYVFKYKTIILDNGVSISSCITNNNEQIRTMDTGTLAC